MHTRICVDRDRSRARDRVNSKRHARARTARECRREQPNDASRFSSTASTSLVGSTGREQAGARMSELLCAESYEVGRVRAPEALRWAVGVAGAPELDT